MEESILKSTKKVLGVGLDDDSFDLDIITHINSAFSNLQSIGIGPAEGFMIVDEDEAWSSFTDLGIESIPMMNMIKTDVYLRVRLLFDPPQTPYHMSAMERQIVEHEWRLNDMREQTDWVEPLPDPLTIEGGDAG